MNDKPAKNIALVPYRVRCGIGVTQSPYFNGEIVYRHNTGRIIKLADGVAGIRISTRSVYESRN